MTDPASPAPPNPILVERAAEAARIEARLDEQLARIAGAPMTMTRRLFVGVMLPPAVAAALAAVAEGLARKVQAVGVPVRWIAPTDYHLTLRFLGPTRLAAEPALVDAIADAVAGRPRLALSVAGLGAFASPDRARIIWAGVDGAGLDELAAAIDGAVVALGGAPLALPFKAHVTLGRLAQDRSISDLLNSTSAQVFSKFDVDSIELLESNETKQQSPYSLVRRIAFKPAETAFQRQSAPLEPHATQQPTATNARLSQPFAPDTDDGWPRGQGPDFRGGEQA